MSDVVTRAARAAREVEGLENDGELTRARIMRSLHGSRQRRGRRAVVLAPLAAVLLGSSAWAGANGKLDGVWEALVRVAKGPLESPSAPAPTPANPARPPAAYRAGSAEIPAARREAPSPRDEIEKEPPEATLQDPAVAPQADDDRAPQVRDARPTRPIRQPKRHTVPGRSSSVPAPRPVPPPRQAESVDPHLDAYRQAHRLHFGSGDPRSALAAWDAYLARSPDGVFVPEARYNRALTLLRMGRHAEATAALEPFAAGAYGGYRQSEARALIDAAPKGK